MAIFGPKGKIELAAYWDAIKDIGDEAFLFAAKELAKDAKASDFWPRPGDVRDKARMMPRPPVAGFLPDPKDCTPPEEAKARLSEIFDRLNSSFGTNLH